MHPDDISYTEKTAYDQTRLEKKTDPAIRYAEILMIYAEALNELTGSYDIPSWDGNKVHSVSRDINEMKKVFVRFVVVQDCLIIVWKYIVVKTNSVLN